MPRNSPDGQLKGVAEFEFATPKLRFAYSDYWLQQSDDMTSYVLVGEVVSSDYAESGYVEKNLKISGLKNPGRRVGALQRTAPRTSIPSATSPRPRERVTR